MLGLLVAGILAHSPEPSAQAHFAVWVETRATLENDWAIEVTNTSRTKSGARLRTVAIRVTGVSAPLLAAPPGWSRSARPGVDHKEWVLTWQAEDDSSAIRPGGRFSTHFLTREPAALTTECSVAFEPGKPIVTDCTAPIEDQPR